MLESKCKLLELSDEVLMIILESLSTADLIFTSRQATTFSLHLNAPRPTQRVEGPRSLSQTRPFNIVYPFAGHAHA